MTSRYQIWMVAGILPEWGELHIRESVQISADCWSVVVEGNGSDLVKFVKSRTDLFFCYVRLDMR